MNKHIIYNVIFYSSIAIISYSAGRLTANKLSKKVETTNIVTAEVKKHEVSVVQEVKKDSAMAKETITRKISYGNNGKIKSETFVESRSGAKTRTGIQTDFNSVDLSSSISETKTTTVSSYQSNWMIHVGYEAPINNQMLIFDARNFEGGIGYRVFSVFYTDLSANFVGRYVKLSEVMMLP